MWGQCFQMSQSKTKVHGQCEKAEKTNDPIVLLKIIFSINFNFLEQKSPIKSFYDALFCFVTLRQHKDETLTSFKDCVDTKWDTLEQCGKIADMQQLANLDPELCNTDESKRTEELCKAAGEQMAKAFKGCATFCKANVGKHLKIDENLEDEFDKNKNNYPKDADAAMHVLVNLSDGKKNKTVPTPNIEGGLQFANVMDM